MTAPLLVPNFAFPVGAAKLVSLFPPLNGPPNALPKTEPPKALVLLDPDVPNGDWSVVPNAVDELLTNAPNPPLADVSVFWASFLSISVFPEVKAPAEAKGLALAAVSEPLNVPNGEVEEPASAAKPEDAKASAGA